MSDRVTLSTKHFSEFGKDENKSVFFFILIVYCYALFNATGNKKLLTSFAIRTEAKLGPFFIFIPYLSLGCYNTRRS